MGARVLIVAPGDERAGALAAGLDRLGWRTVTARSAEAGVVAAGDLKIEAAVVDMAAYGHDGPAVAARLKQARAPRRLPVIGLGAARTREDSEGFDLTLAHPIHPAQAVLRLEQLARTAVAEEEFDLRALTFSAHGVDLLPPEPVSGPAKVLAVGDPAPQFLALSNALAGAKDLGGAEVVGAFTAYTAFDYLQERAFDAVVLWAGDSPSEALAIAAGMRRNTRLFHIPALLYLPADASLTLAEAFNRGVSDVAGPDAAEGETARRVLELARAHRRQAAVRRALDRARTPGVIDGATGLFTRALFAAHLGRLSRAAAAADRPLSLAVFKLSERPELTLARRAGWLERALPQIGGMLGRLVRVEDSPARLGAEVFAVAFPATPQGPARLAAERIAAVIGCTAFNAGDDAPPFVVEFEIGVAELRPGESPAAALERAAGEALGR